MRNKIFGKYGIIESLISISVFLFLCYVNYYFFMRVFDNEKITAHVVFMIVFVDIIGLVLVGLPYLTKRAEKISSEKLKEFLDLPGKDSKFTFPIISGFLSDQALASFLATVLIFTGKQALENYGGAVAAIYTALLYIVALILGSISLIRFITHFNKLHWLFYILASTLSLCIMFAFFNVGLRMAA